MKRKLRVKIHGYISHTCTSIKSLFLEYVSKYATKDAADEAGAETDDDDDMSSVGSYGDDDDDEPAGQMEEV